MSDGMTDKRSQPTNAEKLTAAVKQNDLDAARILALEERVGRLTVQIQGATAEYNRALMELSQLKAQQEDRNNG